IVADTSGHHDALCGPTAEGREQLRLAGLKQGLEPRDIAPPVSFFRGVRVEADGALVATGSGGPGAAVDLLVHLPVVLLVANAPHPLDERPATDLDVVAWAAPEELAALPSTDPEYLRAVQNTESAWTALTLEASAC
ncbi:DUF1989 domain-containing protein, partial [Streptomyces roseolus]|uniref:DUF1989 domain-containing protein n=1 Tax=Streptomyces roseolus TaxID=67358 RepID=UPI003660138F